MNDELIERLRAHAEAHEYIANADHEQKQWMHDLYDAADAIEAYGQPVVLDEDALNKACWAFIDGWRRHTEQKMSGHTWNNLKPIVRATLMKYIDEARPRHPK